MFFIKCENRLIKNQLFFSYLGKPPFNIFKDREDPDQVYVALRNRIKYHLLADFYLEDAVKILKRLIDALPDTLLCVKTYIEKVRMSIWSRKDDFSYTRYEGLGKELFIFNEF